MSAKGQVVIPKSVRDELDWPAGTPLEVLKVAGAVTLRPVAEKRRRLTLEEFERRRPRYEGPSVSLEEMDEAILREAQRRWREKEARSR
ncbi:MAG: AbrB/MazE/SpoVT family DNA-binding domain-containing protein [Alphaproteobacteria bacterium]|nr:AbrB/MazE/SpoVT family DNA-binding domain-containing protein [Alphaproteobacteria bacterium]MBV9370298.1 AbrB/MazE/SpoVT family DNA-binding domain-containing protein [Alphaproteobacteria bacterium]MBV9901172.1 AbrB/MazE/SpoVT family DNA-binding domain-containing protein [Alphaproteobacteria bacterium]